MGPANRIDERTFVQVSEKIITKKNLPAMPALGGEAGLNRYLSEIRKFPVLAPEQEYMLAKRYQEHQDPEAAAQLVTSHLRLVAKIAMGYRGYGLPVSELISEGNRSEEHTSELQSRLHLVCRLLLEKKKTQGFTREVRMSSER